VYLDAAYPYAFDNGKVPTMKEMVDVGFPQPPSLTIPDEAEEGGKQWQAAAARNVTRAGRFRNSSACHAFDRQAVDRPSLARQ